MDKLRSHRPTAQTAMLPWAARNCCAEYSISGACVIASISNKYKSEPTLPTYFTHCLHRYRRTHTFISPHVHARTCTHTRARIYTHTHTHTHTHTLIHTHIRAHTHKLIHLHKYIHKHNSIYLFDSIHISRNLVHLFLILAIFNN